MPGSAQSVARSLFSPAQFTGDGQIDYRGQAAPGHVEVTAEGICLRMARDSEIKKAFWEIVRVQRADYTVTLAFRGDQAVTLQRFARRTNELERALWRCRCDGISRLMAPPDQSALEAVQANGNTPGWLYRYEDGLRWVPQQGAPFARLYGELAEVEFDPDTYALLLRGPFGEHRLQGLARRTTELQHEASTRIAQARQAFADNLQQHGIAWQGEVRSGAISQHVPFAATKERIEAVGSAPGLLADERKEYWQALRAEGLIERLALSCHQNDGLRIVALAPVAGGELYEVLSEEEHATFIFKQADPVLRAWTQVGFRREPIFTEQTDPGPYAALADLLPALAEARAALVRRVVHTSVDTWLAALT